MDRLVNYDWPGNIMELKLCVERSVLYNPKNHIITDVDLENSATPLLDVNYKRRIFGDLPFVCDYKVSLKDRVAIVEREMILSEVKRNNGNKSKAAKEMGISREALRKKLLHSEGVLSSLSNDSGKEKDTDKPITDELKKVA